MTAWPIFRGSGTPHPGIVDLPDPPPWRVFDGGPAVTTPPPEEPELGCRPGKARGQTYQATDDEVQLVNAALYLRRPLLVTGKPGSGKSSLAYAVAYELGLGRVLRWSVTSRSSLVDALYRYDAIGRLQEAELHRTSGTSDGAEGRFFGRRGRGRQGTAVEPDIGRFVCLGPLGTALLARDRPRVLLIDEIDKGDIDLPGDLLNVFEEGEFEIPELSRLPDEQSTVEVMTDDAGIRVPILRGRVRCRKFPFVVLTSNGERDFPPPFLRRCIQLDIQEPDEVRLERIVKAHLDGDLPQHLDLKNLIERFLRARRDEGQLATDQLLNAVFLTTTDQGPPEEKHQELVHRVLRSIGAQ